MRHVLSPVTLLSLYSYANNTKISTEGTKLGVRV